MKKIMFDDRFGLTDAVVDGYKNRTFRINKKLNHPLVTDISELITGKDGRAYVTITYSTGVKDDVYPKYQPGEVVAVAQNYSTALSPLDWVNRLIYKDEIGWTNKMYVRADLMPHRIRFTGVKCERLMNLSEIDCRKEGLINLNWRQYLRQDIDTYGPQPYIDHDVWTLPIFEESIQNAWAEQKPGEFVAKDAKTAFLVLCAKLGHKNPNKLSQENPWGFAYDFELI